jgi:hypothetical protein
VLLPASPAGEDQARRLEDRQVAHDPKARHLRQVRLELEERLAVALEELIQQQPPAAVGNGPENPVLSHLRRV